MRVGTDLTETDSASPSFGQPSVESEVAPVLPAPSLPIVAVTPEAEALVRRPGYAPWPVPSSLLPSPDEARAAIPLPEFDALLLEKARVISSRFPFAEAEYRNLRGTGPAAEHPEIPHFERVFRIAARIASVPNVEEDPDY